MNSRTSCSVLLQYLAITFSSDQFHKTELSANGILKPELSAVVPNGFLLETTTWSDTEFYSVQRNCTCPVSIRSLHDTISPFQKFLTVQR